MQTELEGTITPMVALSPLAHPAAATQSKYERLIVKAKQVAAAATVVVHPCDETSLRGAVEAAQAGIIVPTLVGPVAKITAVARQHGLDIDDYTIVDVTNSDEAAARGWH
jgi:phosphate acetyltransferase